MEHGQTTYLLPTELIADLSLQFSLSLSRWLFNKITTTQSLAWNTEAKCRHSRNVLLTVGCPFLCCGININNNDGLSCFYQSIHPSLVLLQQWQALMGPNEVLLSVCSSQETVWYVHEPLATHPCFSMY